MNLPDGVYVDATVRTDKRGGIGVVYRKDGKIIAVHHCSVSEVHSATAETMAILWGRELFPGETIYSDCSDPAERHGATWIPRGQNQAAHAAAAKGYAGEIEILPPEEPERPKRNKGVKMKKKFRFRGRGVISVKGKRMVFA